MFENTINFIKKTFLYILAPLVIIASYIVYLLNKVDRLKGEIDRSKSSQELAKAIEKKLESDNAANDALGEYESIKSEYLRGRNEKDPADL